MFAIGRIASLQFSHLAIRFAALGSRSSVRWPVLALLLALGAATLGKHAAFLLLPMTAILLSAAVSAVAGFAFSAICGAVLFHLLPDPVTVVQLLILCSTASQASMTWWMRRQVDWGALMVFLAGGAIGLPLGVWLLLHTDSARYLVGLGALLVGYGIWMLLRPPVVLSTRHPAMGLLIGMLGGITGGAAGFPGAPMSIWCGLQGWDKARQRALTQPFILLMQVAALFTIQLSRTGIAVPPPLDELAFVPAALFGTTLGLQLYTRMSDRHFARAVNLLLIVSGLSYIL
jgi:uncharacterized membrane protein YfcA